MARNRLKENIFSLFCLQGANYILPLITVPYLVRVLGPEKFGLIAFAQAFVQYFIVLTDYGFNLSATRLISVNRKDLERRSQIFWSTMWIKAGLMVLSFFLMAGIVLSFPKFSSDWSVYFVSFLLVAGNVLFPVWYFQGIERMKFISAVAISARAISVCAIFILVRNEGDYLLAAGIQASGMIIAGLLGLCFISRAAAIEFRWPRLSWMRESLIEGWHLFISTAGMSLYVNSTAFFLGLFAGNAAVGYFSSAQKLVKAVQGLTSPISQAIYPRVSDLAAHSKDDALQFIRKALNRIGCGALLVSLLLFLLADPLVRIILGPQFLNAITLVRLMAFIPFVVAVSNVFGVQTMITFGFKRQFSRILLLSGLFNISILIPFILIYGAHGAAMSLMLTEIVVALAMGIVLHRNGIHFYNLRVATHEI